MMAGFEQGGVEAFTSGGDRRHDAAGGATVDYNLEAVGRTQRTEGKGKQEEKRILHSGHCK
jgi:hypothetical protein